MPGGVKETFFFDKYYHRGSMWYTKHYKLCTQLNAAEVAPTYFHNPEVPARIRETLGQVRIICTLRDPASRTFSMYLHYMRYGIVTGDFRDAISKHPEILDSGLYATHIKRWHAEFGKHNVLVLFNEDLAASPDEYVRRVSEFLDLEYIAPAPRLWAKINEAALPYNSTLALAGIRIADAIRSAGLYWIVNAAKRAGLKSAFFGKPRSMQLPQLSDEDRSWLIEYFDNEMQELEDILGKSLARWR